MRGIGRNKKILRIAVVLAAVLLTATILAAVTTTTIQAQNQSQNAYPLISAYLQGVSQSPNTVIREKMEISSDYTFTRNIYKRIDVTADNIVIDGNGYTLQGPGSGKGFLLRDISNVTIKNVIVTGWEYGFWLAWSSYNNFSGNTANNNYCGFFQGGSSYNNFSNNTANDNVELGFAITVSDNNNLSGNTANNNRYGFVIHHSSHNNLTGNTAANNSIGFFLDESSTSNNLLGNTALNSGTRGYYWVASSINNDFTGSVEANYLRVDVPDVLGYPISGADVLVETDGTWVYRTPYFGGLDPTTGLNGVTPWIAVTYRTFTTNDTMTINTTNVTVTVYYQGFPIAGDNPRTVSISTSHVETFQVIDDADPTVTITFPPTGVNVSVGGVWIKGTFNGTGSNVISITINSERFTLVEPSGPPYGVTGTFSFRATILMPREFDVEVTVEDAAGYTETAAIHIVVVGLPSAMFYLLMLAGAQGGVSPMVYAAVGVAGVAGVATAVLFYYFRRKV